MEKFILSLREVHFQLLVTEARERGISIQELLRAVIIPEWVAQNLHNQVPAQTLPIS